MIIKALENIRHNGKIYKSEDIIKKIDKEDAERLVNLGVALFIEDLYAQKGKEDGKDESEIDYKSELDEKFNATDLKEVAEHLEIEFPSNTSKTKLIDLIIESGKEKEALEVEFTEED